MPSLPSLENRFELYFFSYFIGFALTYRLHTNYVASLTLAEIYRGKRSQTNLTFYDEDHHLQAIQPKDLVKTLCDEYESRETAEDKIQGIFRNINYNHMVVDAAFIIPSVIVTVLFGVVSDYVGKRRFLLVMGSGSITLYSVLVIFHYYLEGK